jgi:hypothetical protein
MVVAGGLVWLGAVVRPDSKRTNPPVGASGDLSKFLKTYAGGLRQDAPYRPPTDEEQRAATAGLQALFQGKDRIRAARTALKPLGFTVTTGTDSSTHRRYAMAVSERDTERAWGAYLVDLSTPTRLVVEVPHPNFDLGTEQTGLALFRKVPGSVLLVAGAHRRAHESAADVAHREDSLFHAVATELANRDLPQVQLHGFHDLSLPGQDVVLSAGAGEPGRQARRAATELEESFSVCRAWTDDCGKLGGTRNVQGQMAARLDTVFLHVEISRRVRDDESMQAALVRGLAAAFARDKKSSSRATKDKSTTPR